MSTLRALSALTMISLATACVVGCGADRAPTEPRSGTASRLEEGDDSDYTGNEEVADRSDDGDWERTARRDDDGEPWDDEEGDPRGPSTGDQQAWGPLVAIGVVVVAVIGTCAVATAVCQRGANRCVGGVGRTVSSCVADVMSGKVQLDCDVSCPNGEASTSS